MELKITTCYCLCDDFLISKGWRDDPQCTMSTAEVMTAALTAAAFFSGSYEKSCVFLEQHGYMPAMLSKSQFSRRLSSIPESVWRGLTKQLAMPFHEKNSLKIYLADSFPVPVCRNIRIRRCKIYQDECFRGRVSSRKEYFYGLKVHALMTESGIPVEIFLSPGSYSDTNRSCAVEMRSSTITVSCLFAA
ncbi:IS982 family transposase [Candidatus Electronema aureum]